MADPAVAGRMAPASAAADSPAAQTLGLLDQAITLLLDHVAAPQDHAPAWRFGPLVLVSPTADAASAAVITAAARRHLTPAGGTFVIHSGRSIDREIAAALAGDSLGRLAEALSGRRLVVVDRIDQVAGGEHSQARGFRAQYARTKR